MKKYSYRNLDRLEKEYEASNNSQHRAALKIEIEEICLCLREINEVFSDWLHDTGQLDP